MTFGLAPLYADSYAYAGRELRVRCYYVYREDYN